MYRPLVIELFCGRFGWGKGFVSEGYRVVGFDILHESFHGAVPEGCELVLQDVMTLHGSQFRDAAAIVASPPCQKYSYMAMPWDLSKREIRWQKWERDSAFGRFHLNDLFDACFRIQREASEAAGHYIPMVVENVKGAQPWVGRAKWHFGSFYLYGDVPALMPIVERHRKSLHIPLVEVPPGTGKTSWFFGNSKHEGRFYGQKNEGGSWFAQSHNTESGHSKNPVNGVKVGGSVGDDWLTHHNREEFLKRAIKGDGGGWFGDYQAQKDRQDGVKQGGELWHDTGSITRRFSSQSSARKAASAAIAEIPFELASHVARCFKP